MEQIGWFFSITPLDITRIPLISGGWVGGGGDEWDEGRHVADGYQMRVSHRHIQSVYPNHFVKIPIGPGLHHRPTRESVSFFLGENSDCAHSLSQATQCARALE